MSSTAFCRRVCVQWLLFSGKDFRSEPFAGCTMKAKKSCFGSAYEHCTLHSTYLYRLVQGKKPVQDSFGTRLGSLKDSSEHEHGTVSDGNNARFYFFESPDVSTVITGIVEGFTGRFRGILTVLSRVITSALATTIRTVWQLSKCSSLRVIGFTRHPQPTRFYCMGPLSRERECFPFVSCQKKILRR